jgi:hypothetical protein
MTVLIIVAILGVVAYGYLLMARVDRFLNNESFEDGVHEIDNRVVLIYAFDNDYSVIKASLSDKKIPYIQTCEPEIPDNVEIMTVLAVSDNDLDNLLLCCKARHLFPDVFLIAKCNDLLYHSIFINTGIQCVLTGTFTPDVILSNIMKALV